MILARYVLDGIGLDQERDFQAIYLERRRRPGHGGGRPRRGAVGRRLGLARLHDRGAGAKGARFIVPAADEIARVLAKHTFLKSLTLAAGMFPGQDKAIDFVGSWSFVMARPDLDEAVAYRLAKAVHKGEAEHRRQAAPGGRDHCTQHGHCRGGPGPAASGRTAVSAGGAHRSEVTCNAR